MSKKKLKKKRVVTKKKSSAKKKTKPKGSSAEQQDSEPVQRDAVPRDTGKGHRGAPVKTTRMQKHQSR